jgi:hypothetical protein
MNTNRKLALAATAALLVAAIVTILVINSGTPKRITRTTITNACDAGTPDTTLPTAPPADSAWKSVGAFQVPTSKTYGPDRYDGPVWSCYRHDPMGAVLASYVIMAGLADQDWLTVARDQIVPGQGQQAFVQAGEQQSVQPPQPDQVAQPVGFQVVTYTVQQATIDALGDAGDGQYQVSQRTVAWSGGDWKLVVTPDGSTGPDPQLVSSANGFVLWGGTGG